MEPWSSSATPPGAWARRSRCASPRMCRRRSVACCSPRSRRPTTDVTTWGIVVAAGSGTRFGGAKQYERLGAQRVLDFAVQALRPFCDGMVLVVGEAPAGRAEPGVDTGVTGGSTRSESAGGHVVVVAGDPDNIKVTAPHDLVVAAALLALR